MQPLVDSLVGPAPDAGVDMARVVELAERVLADEPTQRSFLGAARGAAMYRAGRYEEGVERLTAAEAAGGATPHCRFFLAMGAGPRSQPTPHESRQSRSGNPLLKHALRVPCSGNKQTFMRAR